MFLAMTKSSYIVRIPQMFLYIVELTVVGCDCGFKKVKGDIFFYGYMGGYKQPVEIKFIVCTC